MKPRTQGPGGPLLLGVLAVAMFGIGLAVGQATDSKPSPSPGAAATPSPRAPAVVGGSISPDLWEAFLNGSGDEQLCALAAQTTCESLRTESSIVFDSLQSLPLTAGSDWATFTPTRVPQGHYIVAVRTPMLEPRVVISSVQEDGTGTILGANAQVRWNGIVWGDLGVLTPGRYIVVVQGVYLGGPSGDRNNLATQGGTAAALVVTAN